MKAIQFPKEDGKVVVFNPKWISKVELSHLKYNQDEWCIVLTICGTDPGVFTKVYETREKAMEVLEYIKESM